MDLQHNRSMLYTIDNNCMTCFASLKSPCVFPSLHFNAPDSQQYLSQMIFFIQSDCTLCVTFVSISKLIYVYYLISLCNNVYLDSLLLLMLICDNMFCSLICGVIPSSFSFVGSQEWIACHDWFHGWLHSFSIVCLPIRMSLFHFNCAHEFSASCCDCWSVICWWRL